MPRRATLRRIASTIRWAFSPDSERAPAGWAVDGAPAAVESLSTALLSRATASTTALIVSGEAAAQAAEALVGAGSGADAAEL